MKGNDIVGNGANFGIVISKLESKRKEQIISSNINEVIKEQFQVFLFFYEDILHTKKSIKWKQATFTQIFLYFWKV